jgi:hypothetical protein
MAMRTPNDKGFAAKAYRILLQQKQAEPYRESGEWSMEVTYESIVGHAVSRACFESWAQCFGTSFVDRG